MNRTLTILTILAFALVAFATAQTSRPATVYGLTAEQQEILGHMSIVYLDDGAGGQTKTGLSYPAQGGRASRFGGQGR